MESFDPALFLRGASTITNALVIHLVVDRRALDLYLILASDHFGDLFCGRLDGAFACERNFGVAHLTVHRETLFVHCLKLFDAACGKRSAVGWEKLYVSVEEDDSSVLTEKIVVFLHCNAPATRGKDNSGALRKLLQCLGLNYSERRFTLVCNDLGRIYDMQDVLGLR